KIGLGDLLGIDAEKDSRLKSKIEADIKRGDTVVLCINGNETRPWSDEREFIAKLSEQKTVVVHLDPRGVGALRPALEVKGRDYADPLIGVEETIAYNAFLVGKSLVGMRVADVLATVSAISERQPKRLVLCGRRDAALVALFAAAIGPAVSRLAVEE